MPIINRIADFAQDMKTWRRDLHQIPELDLDLPKTASYVAARLQDFGVDEIHQGFAGSGIVAIINGQASQGARTIGLRTDMDALPIAEETGVAYASTHMGNMHACGHDGHMAMLLGAARYLAETRKFTGRVALVFQPGEESSGGAGIMVKEGVIDRFGIHEIYGIHNMPGIPFGVMATTPGPMMAAVDTFHIHVKGRGGHGAMPHQTQDPVIAACAIAQALQTIVSRNNDTADDLVISVTQIHTGTIDNVIPEIAYINGTIRGFDKDVLAMVRRRMEEISKGTAIAYGVEAELDYVAGYPPTINDADKALFATAVAQEVVGTTQVDGAFRRIMGAEDFGYFLDARPGAFLMLGQGDGAGLHHPQYNFNDEIAPIGASFFVKLVETFFATQD